MIFFNINSIFLILDLVKLLIQSLKNVRNKVNYFKYYGITRLKYFKNYLLLLLIPFTLKKTILSTNKNRLN